MSFINKFNGRFKSIAPTVSYTCFLKKKTQTLSAFKECSKTLTKNDSINILVNGFEVNNCLGAKYQCLFKNDKLHSYGNDLNKPCPWDQVERKSCKSCWNISVAFCIFIGKSATTAVTVSICLDNTLTCHEIFAYIRICES